MNLPQLGAPHRLTLQLAHLRAVVRIISPAPFLLVALLLTSGWLAGSLSIAYARNSRLSPEFLSMGASGAAGNGVTDDRGAIQHFLSSLKQGAFVVVPPGKRYLIASGDLNVPDNVVIGGGFSPRAPRSAVSLDTSGLILGPSDTIRLGAGAQLRDLAILREGLVPHPTPAQVTAAVALWGSEHGAAVTLPPNLGGQVISDVFIEGFNTAIRAYAGDFSIKDVAGDDYNGIEVSGAGDNFYLDRVRFEPFYSGDTPAGSGAWSRPGIAFDLSGGDTGGFLTHVFSFMYASGVLLNGVGVTQISHSGFEWQSAFATGVHGTKGVRWINHNAQTSIDDTYVNGFDVAVSDEGTGEVMASNVSIPYYARTAFDLRGRTEPAITVTISGKSDSQVILNIILNSQNLGRKLIELTERITRTNGWAAAASELATKINSDQSLISVGVFANSRDAAVYIYPPAGTEVRAELGSAGSPTASIGRGPAQIGSYGEILAPDLSPGNSHAPAFTVGPDSGNWLITSPLIANGALYKGWLSVGRNSRYHLHLSGIAWPKLEATDLVGCGRGSSLASGSSETRGTVFQKDRGTQCTIKFQIAFPGTPTCIVSSPSGARIESYRVSAEGITITHAVQQESTFSWVCKDG